MPLFLYAFFAQKRLNPTTSLNLIRPVVGENKSKRSYIPGMYTTQQVTGRKFPRAQNKLRVRTDYLRFAASIIQQKKGVP